MRFLRGVCVIMVLSGVAGVAAGEESAAGGWWLVIVFGGLLLLTYVSGRSTGRSGGGVSGRSWLATAGVAVVCLLVLVPVALFMLVGGR